MEKIEITPSTLSGTINIPPSKSISHRAVICAGIAEGSSVIENLGSSEDIEATLSGMTALGSTFKKETASVLAASGTDFPTLKNNIIDCRESGSTLRFLMPFAGLLDEPVTFIGKGRLAQRPITSYYNLFDEKNIAYTTTDGVLPVTVKGKLQSGIFNMNGNISSQFITGLLFTLPLLQGDSVINITTEMESKGYIDLTLDMLKQFSIDIENENYTVFKIKGNQKYKCNHITIEGDYSQAAFFLTAGTVGNGLKLSGLSPNSLQGDKVIIDIIKEMGGDILFDDNTITVNKSQTKGIEIDASQCPDLVPILAVLGALSEGTTTIVNAERLRIKESDRLAATASELTKIGADISETKDGLVIQGKPYLEGGCADSWNDHRIAMAIAIASIRCKNPVILTGTSSVKKSYPSFWDDFKMLGGTINELDMGK